MRSDRMLGYEYMEDSSSSQMTGRAGLLAYLDLACVLGVLSESDARIGVCGDQGWMDRQHILSLALLNLAGGEDHGGHSDTGAGLRALSGVC